MKSLIDNIFVERLRFNLGQTSQDGIECAKIKKKCLRAYRPYIYCELSSLLQTAVDLTSLGTMHMEQWKGEAYQVGLKKDSNNFEITCRI